MFPIHRRQTRGKGTITFFISTLTTVHIHSMHHFNSAIRKFLTGVNVIPRGGTYCIKVVQSWNTIKNHMTVPWRAKRKMHRRYNTQPICIFTTHPTQVYTTYHCNPHSSTLVISSASRAILNHTFVDGARSDHHDVHSRNAHVCSQQTGTIGTTRTIENQCWCGLIV